MSIWFVSNCGSLRWCCYNHSCKCLFSSTWADPESATFGHLQLHTVLPVCFWKWLYVLITSLEELLLFHILAKTWHSDRLVLCQYDKFETEFHCGLICISLITNGNKYFYIKAFVFIFYVNCLFVVLAHFFQPGYCFCFIFHCL